MKARNGKVARLPQQVREELNIRLERCEQSPQTLAWLNGLPEAQDFLRRDFAGEPFSKQNLSRWRLGGYQDWLTRRDFFDDVRTAEDFAAESAPGPKTVLADHAATVLAARYGGLIMRWDGNCTPEFEARARVLNGVSRGIIELQREAHRGKQPQSRPVTVSHGDHFPQPVGLAPAQNGNSWHKPGNSE